MSKGDRKDQRLTKDEIDACFEGKDHQADILFGLYRIVIPDWDDVSTVEGWPAVSNATGLYIAQKFVDFDREHHPDCIAGGAWMNHGFSTRDEVTTDWEVWFDWCKVITKQLT